MMEDDTLSVDGRAFHTRLPNWLVVLRDSVSIADNGEVTFIPPIGFLANTGDPDDASVYLFSEEGMATDAIEKSGLDMVAIPIDTTAVFLFVLGMLGDNGFTTVVYDFYRDGLRAQKFAISDMMEVLRGKI